MSWEEIGRELEENRRNINTPTDVRINDFDKFSQFESYSTKYECSPTHSPEMDNIMREMLKQIETPKITYNKEYSDSPHLDLSDPATIQLLCNAGVNLSAIMSPDNRMVKSVEGDNTMESSLSGMLEPLTLSTAAYWHNAGGKVDNIYDPTYIHFNLNTLLQSNNASLSDMAKDQSGCRLLQKSLDDIPAALEIILKEVLDNLVDLMTDPFGNYLCQKLMVVCSEKQLSLLINALWNNLVQISLNMHGTRAVQKLIEIVKTRENTQYLITILEGGVLDLIKDLNGNHVIQKCLLCLPSTDCQFIYDAMENNCVELATHRHGCCVMQRCIDSANLEQRASLVENIVDNTLVLVEDAFGNYVVQYVMKLKDETINCKILELLLPNLYELAKQKFSSNVVERLLIYGPDEVRKSIVETLLNEPPEAFKMLILDPYGNYVIQRMLSFTRGEELNSILNMIKPYLNELRVLSTGKRIAAKIAKKHPNLFTDINNFENTDDESRRFRRSSRYKVH